MGYLYFKRRIKCSSGNFYSDGPKCIFFHDFVKVIQREISIAGSAGRNNICKLSVGQNTEPWNREDISL